jgi:two-component system, response regulator PdtaR
MKSDRKILVVDDHVDLAENIAEILSGAGYQTATADSAEAALVQLDREPFAAVITDYRLPGLSGAQLITEVRRRGLGIPAVVMSAYTDDDTIEIARTAGAMDVLAKPVSVPRLFGLIESLAKDEPVVLVVDDNRALAENIAEALDAKGYEAIISHTASDAFSITTRPRAAIVDYRLPDASGIEVAERLTSRDPRTQILFVSGFADDLREQLRGRMAQAPTIAKPIDVQALLEWVAKAMEHGQSARPRR